MNFASSDAVVKKLSSSLAIIISLSVVMSLAAVVLSFNAAENAFLSPAVVLVAAIFMTGVFLYLTSSLQKSVKSAFAPMKDKIDWYENILDSIPFPLSITDMDMKWTFINRPVEEMLNIKRASVLGKHCSNWGAKICNTQNCGITCLKNGKNETFFEQMGMDFQVDISYILDENKKRIGHIEFVQNISKMMQVQRSQADLIENVHETSEAFADVSRNIAESSQLLAQGSADQSSAVDELSNSLYNVENKTKENASTAQKASNLAEAIKTNAEKGSVQMSRMAQAVKEINEASQSINHVIKTIDEIAAQTNLLALNAAIEAARAGQHGRGFAVVAEEVRDLAEKSIEAAKDTGALIVNSMEKAALGMNLANETTTAFSEIVTSISQSSQLVSEIDNSMSSQILAINSINKKLNQVAQIVQQNSSIAEESAAVSQEINSRADTLKNLLAAFKHEHMTD